MLQRILSRLGLALLFAASLAGAQEVSRIRVMLHPDTAAPGALPLAAFTKLQALAGVPLTVASSTRTGALEFDLGAPLSSADATLLVRRLREDRGVLWAEPIYPAALAAKAQALSPFQGRQLMVRVAVGVAPDWSALLPRFTDLAGMPLAVERQIGSVWVLSLAQS